MNIEQFVRERVHESYWQYDLNCATTNLNILSAVYGFDLNDQVVDAALGMHGAGKFGAQCGLVEGGLMFIGLIGRSKGIPDEKTIQACQDYARQFEARFGSLLCRELRPEGFPPEPQPRHICEPLSVDAVLFTIAFVNVFLNGA